jgi:hypothetical protein
VSNSDHVPSRAVAYALHEVGRHFEIFARIGRWGDCGGCPRSGGKVYPEFCEFTTRYDHKLDAGGLAFQYERAVKAGEERVRREQEVR